MKKLYSFVVLSVSCLMATAGMVSCAIQPSHSHTFSELHQKVEATCHSTGTEAYYSCTGCDKVFNEAKEEVPMESLIIPMTAHHGVHVDAEQATCTHEGHIEYWTCDGGCGKYFSDANCTTEITLEQTKTEKVPHNLTKIPGQAETCQADGWKDAWKCSSCGDYFEDEQGKTKIGNTAAYNAWVLAGGKIAKHAHTTTEVPGQASTCSRHGHKDAYQCEECHDFFEDEAGTILIGDLDDYGAWKHNPDGGELALDGDKHHLHEVAAVAPSCTAPGHQAAWHCEECENYFLDSEGKNLIGNKAAYDLWIAKGGAGYIPVAEHNYQEVDGTPSTCTEHGYKEADKCTYCGTYFEQDEVRTVIGNEAAYEAWKDNPAGGQLPFSDHILEKVDGTPSTCIEHGYAEAWICKYCEDYFEDMAGQNLIGDEAAYEAWILNPAGGQLPYADHIAVKVPGEAPTCDEPGYKDAWQCSYCEDYFEDEQCTKEIGDENAYLDWIVTDGAINPNGHDMQEIAGKAETCTQNGYKQAWCCQECKKYFEDIEGNTLIGDAEDYEAWIDDPDGGLIPMHAHSGQKIAGQPKDACRADGWNDAWKCNECTNYFSDSQCQELIGDADDYAAWKVGAGKIAKDAHTLGTLVPEVDAEREKDGVKAHSSCSVCSQLFDEEGNPTTDEALKIPSRFVTFTANAKKTVSLDRTYALNEKFVLDVKNDGVESQYVRFMLFNTESWDDYFGYFEISQNGTKDSYTGVKVLTITDDGYIRLEFDLGNLAKVTGSPSSVNALYLDFRWSDAPGSLEYNPSIKAHDLGKLIEAKEAGPHDDTGWDAHYVCQECGKLFDVNGVEKTVEELTRKNYVSYSPADTLAEFANLGHLTDKVAIDLYFENPTVHQEVGINFYNDPWDNYFGTYWVDCDDSGVYFEKEYEGLMLDKLEDGWWRVTANIPALNNFVQDKKEIERAQVVDFIYIKGPNTVSNRGSGKIELNSTYDSVVPSTKVYSLSGGDKYVLDRSFLPNETINLDFKFTSGDIIKFVLMQGWNSVLSFNLNSNGTLVDQKAGVQVFKLNNELSDYPTLSGDWWRVIIDLRYIDGPAAGFTCISRIGATKWNEASFDMMINSLYTTDGWYNWAGGSENTPINIRTSNVAVIRDNDGELIPNKAYRMQVRGVGSGKVKFALMEHNSWKNCGNLTITFADGVITEAIIQGSANKWASVTAVGDGSYYLTFTFDKFPGDGFNESSSIGFFYGDGVLANGVTSFGINLLNCGLVDA